MVGDRHMGETVGEQGDERDTVYSAGYPEKDMVSLGDHMIVVHRLPGFFREIRFFHFTPCF